MDRLLVLVRHGQSEWNLKNLFTGWRDIDLSELGVKEARSAGSKLKAKGLVFDLAYTSALVRAQNTLKLMLDELGQTGLEEHRDQALNERDYGDLSGLNKDDARKKWGEEQVHVWRRSYDTNPPGGESLRDTGARVWPYYLTRILPDVMRGKRVLVSAHGNSLRSLVMVLDKLTPDQVTKLEIATGVPLVYRLNADTTVEKKEDSWGLSVHYRIMTATVDTSLDRIGRWLAGRLRRESSGYEPYTPSDPDTLRAVLRPGDVLLVEGHQYISMVIEYLTMSTWSHAAVFVGDIPGLSEPDGEPHVLVEVNLGEGCVSAPLSRYTTFNTRLCRPIMLSYPDQQRVARYMIERIGLRYDMRNLFDMIRFFFPVPIPRSWRRRAIALGSGDPTRAICSSLIAEAFQSVGYPILPRLAKPTADDAKTRRMRIQHYYIRHHSLFAPRDFDLSPYFAVVKPTIERGFDYKSIRWVSEDAAAELALRGGVDADDAAPAT